jgi:hypothetical protein
LLSTTKRLFFLLNFRYAPKISKRLHHKKLTKTNKIDLMRKKGEKNRN